jgi:DNA transformation protein and related proteins
MVGPRVQPPCRTAANFAPHYTARMSVPASFVTYCSELLAGAGQVHARRMFGGCGLYVDDVFVAIIVGETLYLKADEQSQSHFEAAGCSRFSYAVRGRQQAMGFWTVPPEAMDSPRLMQPWARLAVEAALRARAAGGRRR